MQTTLALAAAFAAVAHAASPTGSAPAGFVTTYASPFQITAVNSTVIVKRDIAKRGACPTSEGSLVITLKDGVLTDQKGRIADIVSNYQFQFDPAPGQAGAIYNSGFSVGSNSSLALGSSAVWYECLSGGFYNLYSKSISSYCEPVLIDILPCGDSSSGEVTQGSDGQPAATGVATAVSQISDGQPQAQSATAVISQISDGQAQAPSAIPITQISDGQPQIPTAVISQISDGQPQAPTSLPMPITQISDGQPQAPTSTPAPISQISDGQPQAPTTLAPAKSSPAPAVISQISDGQIQAPNATAVTTPTKPAEVSASGGNAVVVGSSFAAVVAGLVAALL